MSDAFVGEVRMFAGSGTRIPSNWHLCDGTVLPINGYQVLFTLIGKTYGGDGITNFALPDLRSRIPVGVGTGIGLTAKTLAQTGGQEQVVLTADQIPAHTHTLQANPVAATLGQPAGTVFANSASSTTTLEQHYLKPGATISTTWVLNPSAVTSTGTGTAHENRMPSIGMNFMICLNGYYPNFN